MQSASRGWEGKEINRLHPKEGGQALSTTFGTVRAVTDDSLKQVSWSRVHAESRRETMSAQDAYTEGGWSRERTKRQCPLPTSQTSSNQSLPHDQVAFHLSPLTASCFLRRIQPFPMDLWAFLLAPLYISSILFLPGTSSFPKTVPLVILLSTGCLPALRPPPMAHRTPLFIPLMPLSESTISPLREGPGPHDSPLVRAQCCVQH